MSPKRYSVGHLLAALLFLAWWGPRQARAQVVVTLPDLEGVAGGSVAVPVTVGDLTGLDVSGYQFTVTYDPDVFILTGVEAAGTLSEGLTTLSNSPSPGTFKVVGAGATPIAGAGTLLTLKGAYVDPGTTALRWSSFIFDNTAVSADLSDGRVTVALRVTEVPVSLPAVSGRPGGTAVLPISVGDLTGLGVTGFACTVTFDPDVLQITGVETAGTLSAGRAVQTSRPDAGSFTLTVAGDALTGSGVLVKLTGRYGDRGTTDVGWSSFTFDQAAVTPVLADGQAEVANDEPRFTSTPITTARVGRPYAYTAVATDPDGDALVLAAATLPTWLSFTDHGDGTGTLAGTPGQGAVGTHNVVLIVTDSYGGDGRQSFTIEVAPNGAPVAVDDEAATNTDEPVVIDVLVNDTDPDGDALTVQRASGADDGTVAVNADGTVTYTPRLSFVGVDAFTYSASDGVATDDATVTVTVGPANGAPVAQDDEGTTDEHVAVTIDVLANDTDPDGDALTVTQASGAANGSLRINPDGTITYTPAEHFNGDDAFTYTVSDGLAGDQARVTVVVRAINDAPSAPGIVTPADGTDVLLAGDPATLFTVEWTEALDPDDDEVTYTVQISLTEDFSQDVYGVEVGSETLASMEFGAIGVFLTDAGVGLDESALLYIRVLASDSDVQTASSIIRCSFFRGAITDVEGPGELPAELVLYPNYPNPFNPATTIRYAVPHAQHVRIAVYDLLGREVTTLVDAWTSAGFHEVVATADDLPAGTYFYRLQAATFTATRTFTLLK